MSLTSNFGPSCHVSSWFSDTCFSIGREEGGGVAVVGGCGLGEVAHHGLGGAAGVGLHRLMRLLEVGSGSGVGQLHIRTTGEALLDLHGVAVKCPREILRHVLHRGLECHNLLAHVGCDHRVDSGLVRHLPPEPSEPSHQALFISRGFTL